MGGEKKYTFKVYWFNEETREVEVVATCKTKPTTAERAHELAKLECQKSSKPNCVCYQMVTK